jgi:hypothetical protein
MGLTFLVPAFLAGLAALAIPVVLHLLNRERKEAIRFPSLMFVRRIPYRSIRRKSLRHPWLLLLRCIALALMAAAFSRPFFDRTDAAAASAPSAREVAVLLDRSYSMGYGDRWERARAAARSAVSGVRPGDRVSLIAFDERASVEAEPTTDPATLNAAIGRVNLGWGTTRFDRAMAAAAELFARSDRTRREIVVISDLQRLGWDGREEGRAPAGTEVRVVNLSDSITSNVLVSGIETRRDSQDARPRVRVLARLVNRGAAAATRQVTLEVGGRAVETVSVELPARGAATASFAPLAVPQGTSRATVRSAADALRQDDVFHFGLSRGEALRVVVVGRPGARARSALYLRTALGVGREPPLEVITRTVDRVTPADLDGAELVVLNDVGLPPGAAGARLESLVRAGAGLLVVAGDGGGSAARAAARGLIPGTLAVADRSADNGARLGYVERSHPALAAFSAPRSGDFSTARFLRYRPVIADSGDAVLARFDDGAAALVERRVGAGRVLMWGSTLDDFWNDLPLQPVFVPLVHGLVRHAAGFVPTPLWYDVGRSVGVATLAAGMPSGSSAALDAVTPSGARVALGDGGAASLELVEPGFYEVRPRGERSAARLVAANLDRAESDLAAWNAEELAAALVSRDSAPVSEAALAAAAPAEREQRQSIWWYLLAAGALLLAVETVLANRLSPRAAGAPAPSLRLSKERAR